MAETITRVSCSFVDDAPVREQAPDAPCNAWPVPARIPALAESDVHVWLLNLDPQIDVHELASHLNADELARAGRFHFQIHRSRFIAARAQMRVLLAHYLRLVPEELEFAHGTAGKPVLGARSAKSGLEFNLSHSENIGLLAVGRSGALGVDVERIRPLSDAADLVERFFSPRESIAFARLAEDVRPEAFFNLWTRKEALLKGTGEGIAHSLNRVEVTFLPGEPARLLAAPACFGTRPWRLCELLPLRGFACALAVDHSPVQVSCWRWTGRSPSTKGVR